MAAALALWCGCMGSAAGDGGAKHIILFIADGWGANQIQACDKYTDTSGIYEAWDAYFMSTWDLNTQQANRGIGYDPNLAWSNFYYAALAATDSASSATAMYTGHKVDPGNINTSHNDEERLTNIGEIAARNGMAYGAVSSVMVSHATPGAFYAHNDNRGNGCAIACEGLWGNPTACGSAEEKGYGGGRGTTMYRPGAIIGGGHPKWDDGYVSMAIRDKLADQSGKPGAWTFVERIEGSPDGGARLQAAADDPETTRLAGLFGGKGGNFEYRLADGSGRNPENPTLAECALAAVKVLSRDEDGFMLMVEGGAVDWANHGNNLNQMIGEMIGFNNAVAAVSAWVDDPTNGSSWNNTLVIVTGDHECGYLTAGPGVFPDKPLGEVSDRTLALEKTVGESKRRASWEDTDGDGDIDEGETVYWAYNSGGHTNILIPLYAKGAGADWLDEYAVYTDPVRGRYLDNTSIFEVMWQAMVWGGVTRNDTP